MLKDQLGQLVKVGYLKEFVVDFGNLSTRQGAQQRGDPLPPPLGVIEIIHAASRGANRSTRGKLPGRVITQEEDEDRSGAHRF